MAKVVGTYISGSSKVSKTGGDRYTPFELLSRDDGREDFRRRAWVEYVEATQGFKRINFSARWRASVGYHESGHKLEKTGVRWSFEPSDRLVFLFRKKPEARREVMRLASEGLPVDLVVFIDEAFSGAPRGDRDKTDPLVGSAIVDYGGMSSVDKEVLSSLCGVMTQGSFVDTAYRFIRHGDGVPMWEALRYRDAVRSGTADEFVIDDLAVDYEEL